MEELQKRYEFDAVLHEVPNTGGAYVIFPWDIRKEFGKGRVKVHAEFDGISYDGSIVNMGVKNADGSICYIIGVLKRIRTALGKKDGDLIHVVIRDQDHYCTKPQSIDEDIAVQGEKVRPKLNEIRVILRAALPDAEERISWSMPTYCKGRNLIHFAASKKHLGLYPGDEAVAHFAEELKDCDVSKGSIRLPYETDLPAELIQRIARWCYEAYAK